MEKKKTKRLIAKSSDLSKDSNSNTEIKRDVESENAWVEQYLDLNMGKIKPMNINAIEEMYYQFWLDAKSNPNNILVADYFERKGVPSASVYRLAGKSEKAMAYFTEGKEAIGNRRERMAFAKEVSEPIFTKSAHQYNKRWEDSDRHHADIRKEVEKAAQQVVVIERFPEPEDKK